MNVERLEPRRLLAAGDVDLSFGGGDGIVTDPGPADLSVNDALVMPDGKIIVAGAADMDQGDEDDGDDYLFRRYNADGTPDATFGGGDGTASGRLNGHHVLVRAIEPAPGGKFVAALRESSSGVAFPFPGYVARFNSDGSLDTTFSDDGFASVTLENAEAVHIAVQDDGGVVFVHEYHIKRYRPDGSLDTAFGNAGTLDTVGFAATVRALPGGKILAGMVFPEAADGVEFALARLNADGSSDTAFGDSGRVLTQQVVSNIVVLPSGKILVSGELPGYTNGIRQRASRFTADGDLDTTFGDAGSTQTTLDGSTMRTFVDDAGRIYLTAISAGATRLTPDGDLDETFGSVYGQGSSDFLGFPAGVTNDRLIFAGAEGFSNPNGRKYMLLARRTEDDGVPSAITFADGVVSAAGTSGDDFIYTQDFPFAGVKIDGFGRLFNTADVDLIRVTAGDGNDIVWAENRSTSVHFAGGSGRDKLAGGGGNDTLEGNAQRDFIDSGLGADLIIGNGGKDQLRGEGGADHVYGRAGDDHLMGNGGNDRLDGGDGLDAIEGGGGDDVLLAADGNVDFLFGGDGADSADTDDDDVLDGIEQG